MLPLQFHTSPTEREHKKLDSRLDAILVHRILVGTRTADIVRAFTSMIPELVNAFGGKFPYHFVVEGDGSVFQVLPLSRRGLHAKAWNTNAVGVACVGDYRRDAPGFPQWNAAKMLCALLSAPQGWDVLGHTEAHKRGPEATGDPTKDCPGRRWDMTTFREEMWDLAIESCDINTFWRRVKC